LRARPREDAFVCAIGAFTPTMVEWAADVCTYMAQHGRVFVDTRDADHEAGDLLQAGLDVTQFPALQALIRGEVSGAYAQSGPVFFQKLWLGRLGFGCRKVRGATTRDLLLGTFREPAADTNSIRRCSCSKHRIIGGFYALW